MTTREKMGLVVVGALALGLGVGRWSAPRGSSSERTVFVQRSADITASHQETTTHDQEGTEHERTVTITMMPVRRIETKPDGTKVETESGGKVTTTTDRDKKDVSHQKTSVTDNVKIQIKEIQTIQIKTVEVPAPEPRVSLGVFGTWDGAGRPQAGVDGALRVWGPVHVEGEVLDDRTWSVKTSLRWSF